MNWRVNFHSRVLLCFVGMLMLALFGAATAMYLAADRTSLALARQQLSVAQRVAENELALRDRQLRESTRVGAADPSFREAVTSGDKPTVRSALENERARVRADLTAVLDDAGNVRASTDGGFDAADPALLAAAIADRDHRTPWSILALNGRLLQFVVVPVHATSTSGWLCNGHYVDEDVANQIKAMAGVDISFIAADSDNRSGLVSTLPIAARASLSPEMLAGSAGAGPHKIAAGGIEYLTVVSSFSSMPGGQFTVVLQIPTAVAAAPLADLRRDLLIAGALITLLCLAAAMFSSHKLAKPVRALGDAARSLSRRDPEAGSAAGEDDLAYVAKVFHSLLRRAHYDALTGLPNRTLLTMRLDDSMARAKSQAATLAVVFIDLNGFKAINDTLGHEMGDLVLRKTAKRLSKSIAAPHTVARVGGDEFVIVLENTSQDAALREVERLIPIVSTPMKAPGKSIKVGMSAGIAMYPEIATECEELMKLADTAMYQSKLRKGVPVVAKPAVIVEPGSRIGKQTATALPPPVAEADTWNGPWVGKDLYTQRSKILPIARGGASAPIPPDEAQRLAALRSTELLDSSRDPSFDRVTRLAARALGIPITLISLVDENRQWFLSRFGMAASETPRNVSFSAHAVFNRELLVVSDARLDARFADNPLVTDDPHIRAYAGAPLFSKGGYALGTLCAIDRRPRDFSEDMIDTLQDLANIVQDLILEHETQLRARKSA